MKSQHNPSNPITPRTGSTPRLRLAFRGGLAAACALAAAAASASDWPQWRGPLRNDISTETGLLKQWPAGGPPLAWKATGCGIGYSSVAVARGRVFTMGDSSGTSHVRAFDERTGQPLWTSPPLGKAAGDPPGTRSTPTVDGDLVYALGQLGDWVCLEAATGKEQWRKSLKDFGGSAPGWLYSESPLVDGDRVVCTPGGPRGAIVALNKKTGELIWQSKDFTDPAHYSSLIVATIGGQRQYLQLTEASVAGVSAADGRLLWRADRKGQTAVVPTPVFFDNCVFVTSGYGVGCNLFRVAATGAGFTATQVYANKVMQNHHGGVVKVGDHLYGHSDSKGWTCQDFKTGNAVWQESKLGKGSLTYADGMLYLRDQDGKGTVALIKATPKGWSEKGRFDQPDRSDKNSWAHPVVANGRLHLRDQDVLLCYDVKQR